MKNHCFLIAVFFLTIQFSNAQTYGAAPGAGVTPESNPYSNFQKKTPMMQELFSKLRNDNEQIKYDVGSTIGSPFENKEYKSGKVYYDKEYLGNYYYRFNAYNQEIELKKTLLPEEKMQALIQDPKVILATNDENYIYTEMITQNEKTENGYLKLFYQDDTYTLYERYIVKFKEGKPAENSMVTSIPSKFSNYIEYYYKGNTDNAIKEIPQKQSKFLKLFKKSNSAEIKDYIKTNNLDLSNKDDLKNIYSSLEN